VLAQALDGSPVAASRVSSLASFGDRYSPSTFPEEFVSVGRQEDSIETDPGRGRVYSAVPGREMNDLNIIINNERALSSYDVSEFIGTSAGFGASDVIYATRFANQDILDLLATKATLTSATIETNVLDASVVPKFQRVALVTGTIDENGFAQLDLQSPLRQERDFVAQDSDDTPFYLGGTRGITRSLINQLQGNPDLDLFIIVEVANDFDTGPSNLPPLIAVDNNSAFGNSFLSLNGNGFAPINLNFAIQLRFTGE